MSYVYMSHVINMYRRPYYEVATISGLLKFIGVFSEYSLFSWALLQKRPIIFRSLRIVATPYQLVHCSLSHTNLPKNVCVHIISTYTSMKALRAVLHGQFGADQSIKNVQHITKVLDSRYGVATISRLLKIIGLFCKRAL